MSRPQWKSVAEALCLALLSLGLVFRFFLFYTGAWMSYQHDVFSHVELVHYISVNGEWPNINELWQAPQQPLYYWIASFFWHPSSPPIELDMMPLAFLSMVISSATLVFIFFATNVFRCDVVRIAFVGFLSLTPSFVLASCRISNDTLAASLGQIVFGCACFGWREPRRVYWLGIAMVCSLLAIASKLNAISILPVLPFIFLRIWFYSTETRVLLVTMSLCFFVALSFWAAWSLWRSYIPEENRLKFASYELWEPQVIPKLSTSYWMSFHYRELLNAANAGTGASSSDMVRFSFLTEHYGSMFTGEYRFEGKLFFRWLVRTIYVFGLIVPIGFISSIMVLIRNLNRCNLLFSPKMLCPAVAAMVTSLALIVALVAQCPNVCSSDFRYHAPILPWISLVFASGIASLGVTRFRVKILLGLLITLFLAEGLLVSFIVLGAI